jgi:hypothetical protein
VVRPRGAGAGNPRAPTIKYFPLIVKEADMKYIVFVVIFVAVYVVVRRIIRKVTGK